MKRARHAIESVKEAFKVKEGRLPAASAFYIVHASVIRIVPKRVINSRKDEHVRARDEGEELLLENVPHKKAKLGSPSASRPHMYSQGGVISKTKIKGNDSDSDTESESEPEDLLLDAMDEDKDEQKPSQDVDMLLTPARSLSPKIESESGRAPGRIVGMQHPLEDFR